MILLYYIWIDKRKYNRMRTTEIKIFCLFEWRSEEEKHDWKKIWKKFKLSNKFNLHSTCCIFSCNRKIVNKKRQQSRTHNHQFPTITAAHSNLPKTKQHCGSPTNWTLIIRMEHKATKIGCARGWDDKPMGLFRKAPQKMQILPESHQRGGLVVEEEPGLRLRTRRLS